MKTNIRGDKVEITKGIRDHIESKLEKLNVYFDNPDEITANIIVRVRNLEQIVEVTVPTRRFTLRSEESHSDLYAAVDIVIDKLERQIRKNKTRLSRYKKEEPVYFNMDFEEDLEDTSKIIKRKGINMKPMDEEEAILQMELLNHDFFVFKNIDEDCISVLYKRKDGNFGIINAK